MKNNAIGLFDSGVGGMTVLRAMLDTLPHENYIYLGDTARLPYGTKSQETVIKYALQCTKKLIEYDLKLLIVACNTVSSIALPALREAYPHIKIMGVVESGAKAACAVSKNNHIAILGTESTIQGKAYDGAIYQINRQSIVVSKACPLFVSMAEDGLTEGFLAEGLAERYLAEIFHQKDTPDTLVLGCTHFPLLKNAIQNVVGNHVNVVDSASTIAQAVKEYLSENNLCLETQTENNLHFLTTDDVKRFAKMGQNFLGLSLDNHNVELVDL